LTHAGTAAINVLLRRMKQTTLVGSRDIHI